MHVDEKRAFLQNKLPVSVNSAERQLTDYGLSTKKPRFYQTIPKSNLTRPKRTQKACV